jgi:solute carrier family 35 protein F5
MQRELREDDPDVPALFFGYVGVLVAVLGAPVVLLLHVLGSYDLRALNPAALGLALLNGLMDYVVADYTWARAVLLLSPTVATLGTSIQVPIATAADVFLGAPHWLYSWKAVGLTAAGTVLILGGVGGINLDPYRHSSAAHIDSQRPDPEAADSSRTPLLEPE